MALERDVLFAQGHVITLNEREQRCVIVDPVPGIVGEFDVSLSSLAIQVFPRDVFDCYKVLSH